MKHEKKEKSKSRGWGTVEGEGTEMWDAPPVFIGEHITIKDRLKLVFYPKKFLLYKYVRRAVNQAKREGRKPRIIDIGCGTGGAVVDFKKMFGRSVEVIGLDVIQLQTDVAKIKIKESGVWAEILWFDGKTLPFSDGTVDVVYSSDVLGHVSDVPSWLLEITRALKQGGTLAMFAESKLGRHAYIRNYMFKRGLNTDPHAEHHISLYSKTELIDLLGKAGFVIKKMYSVFWAKFFVHPDEMYEALHKQNKFFFLKNINGLLNFIKIHTKPFSLAVAELYGLIEMLMIGWWIEAQGYVILAKKDKVMENVRDEGITKFTSMPVTMEVPTAVREVES